MGYQITVIENDNSENTVEINNNTHLLELTADPNDKNIDIIESGKYTIEIGIPYILPSGFGQFISGGYGIYTYYDNNLNILTISATGLQPSGDYASAIHNHTSNQITNFNSSVSGLLPNISGSGYVISDFSNNVYTISVSGLQPSGIYASGIHYHVSSDISNFDSSVSGLLPVKNISSGSGINVVNNSGDFTVSVTGSFGLTSEQVDDRVYDLLQAGSYVNLSYDDSNNSLTVAVTGLQPSGNYSIVGHTHTSSQITDFSSSVNSLVSGIYAPLNSPALTGVPTAPTAPSGNNTTQIANTQFVRSEISNLVNSAPSTLDTLNELATALGNDPNFATTIASGLAQKSNIGHTHTYSEITNFNSGVSGLLPSISGSGYVNTSFNNNTYSISVSGLQPSGNYSIVGHNHSSSDITDFNSSVSGLLPVTNIVSGSYINVSQSGTVFTISSTGLQPSGDYSVVGHTHYSSDISDFNSAVSGLLPVKEIVAGTGIGISSSSGTYTINSTSTLSSDTLEPDGFVNRTDSYISFDNNSRQFSIAPKSPATSYTIYNNGTKVIKNTTESITLPNSTALYFLHFDKIDNSLSYKTTGFDFYTDIPIAHIYYNADFSKAVYFGEERHGLRMDSATHKYLHNVFGTQYINGLSISNYTLSGNGSSNSDATISIGDGLIYDEDIEATITHSNTPTNPFEQVLYPIAQLPVYYKFGASGAWTDTTANDYPVKTGTTIQYNLLNGGSWSASNSDNPANSRFIAYWICATTQENAPIISIMGQRLDSSLLQSQSNNTWSGLNLTGLPIVELRPLYRVIYETKSSFSNTPKGFLIDILDIRSHNDTITGVTQNDHGNLYGLADDDHAQYVHIDNARNIDAIHTFNNGLISSGLIQSTSGNFDSLTVNNIDVSVSGHYHLSSDISDFNSTVSGLLPITDISAGSYINITSSGTNFTISSTGLQPSGNYSLSGHSHVSNDITDFSSSVSGLLPSVTGSGYVSSVFDNNLYTLSVNGLQPSGNYSIVGHSHTNSEITDFNSGVSGLLPVTDIIGGTNISVIPSGSVFTVNVSGSLGLTTEEVDDRVSNLLVAGTGITLNYNDNDNILTISSSGLQPSGNYSLVGHTHSSSNITDFNSSVSGLLPITSVTGGTNINVSTSGTIFTISVSGSLGLTTEEVDDRISNLLVAGSGISISYNDNANTLTLSSIPNDVLSDFVTNTNYIGVAPGGSLTSQSVWIIRKTVYGSDGSASSHTTATNVKWTDRLTATYS